MKKQSVPSLVFAMQCYIKYKHYDSIGEDMLAAKWLKKSDDIAAQVYALRRLEKQTGVTA